jgi:hypothetical protein
VNLVRRAAALMLVTIVSALPLALERCRVACAQASASESAPSSAHACHDTADAEDGPALTPSPRACGHSDEARTADLNAVAPNVRLDHAIAPLPVATSIWLVRLEAGPVAVRPPDPQSVETSRNLPLRL